jgi:hypothetical protein
MLVTLSYVVGQDVWRHLGTDVLSVFIWKCVDPNHDSVARVDARRSGDKGALPWDFDRASLARSQRRFVLPT